MQNAIRQLLAIICIAGTPFAALANDTLVPGQSVVDRVRPEVDAQGMPIGAFRLFPAVDLAARHDSNLFADDRDEQDDLITLVSPSIELKSDWARHSLNLRARSDFARYRRSTQENYADTHVDAGLRFDVSRASALRFSANYDDTHEDRASPDDVLGVEPTRLGRGNLSLSYARRSGRLSFDVDASRFVLDYDDVPGTTGVINNDDRDRDRQTLALRTGFQVGRTLDLVLRAEADTQEYDVALDDNGLNRSSDGVRGGIGIEGALGGATYAEAFAGYSARRYDDAGLADIHTPWFDGRLVWNPSGLTTITLAGQRSIDETTFAPASGYRATRIDAAIDHELLRKLLLHASVFSQQDEYAGADRQDERFGFAVGASYLMNRNFRLALEFRRRERQSILNGIDTDDFTIDTVTLTITGQR